MERAFELIQAYCFLVWDIYSAYCEKTEFWPAPLVIALPFAVGFVLHAILPYFVFMLIVSAIAVPLMTMLATFMIFGMATIKSRR
ncbi:hypothetical protein [Vogesella sp. XCS3]|uniref:hypothetical protein n=1 Tax=Vogesella sp. XCS3 TaxID=2877939 RepID=UPI001D0BB546|nr:hypothetical protein [Vogesella sp. XCS3]UDM18856.1 hypothetical protein LCH97_18470 [Vogesella sp. XCS3]